jgi:hypothetical protein
MMPLSAAIVELSSAWAVPEDANTRTTDNAAVWQK